MPDMHHQMTAANKVCLAQLPLPKVAQIFIQALTTQLLLQRNGDFLMPHYMHAHGYALGILRALATTCAQYFCILQAGLTRRSASAQSHNCPLTSGAAINEPSLHQSFPCLMWRVRLSASKPWQAYWI